MNLAYHFAIWRGRAIRNRYRAALPRIVSQGIEAPRKIDIDVFAYSNEEMLPEQIASIRSFLRHAGRPKSFTVVSDGSHSPRSIRLLEDVDLSVKVRSSVLPPPNVPEKLRNYLANHYTGKQLALIMSLEHALYVDADVLFFPGASDLVRQIEQRDAPAYYLADCQFAGDEHLLRDESEKRDPVNTGVLLLFQKLDWSLALERFLQLGGAPAFHTNQTLTHLAMHRNGARPLDPAKYVLQLDDQAIWQDRHAGPELVLRHYVNPVRHKFWTSLKQ
ncbi:MAG: hypothetical protein QOG48_78 [Verrucomicrobiota bacterium]|jgi:hypothetical protein